ncbi:BCCT family transporter [Streptomyces sp. NPDC056503]|uniref:BCCT family transporter n=1 Tax=Streptomyces sp. NPDC056503 TaxID=3345842 RepID=UPI0036A60B7E
MSTDMNDRTAPDHVPERHGPDGKAIGIGAAAVVAVAGRAWRLSRAPFADTFVARISRGRTIREFPVGVPLVPSGAPTVRFCVRGGAAIRLESTGEAAPATAVEDGDEPPRDGGTA